MGKKDNNQAKKSLETSVVEEQTKPVPPKGTEEAVKKFGIKEENEALFELAISAHQVNPDDIFALKVYNAKKIVIVTKAGKKCEFIDARPEKPIAPAGDK